MRHWHEILHLISRNNVDMVMKVKTVRVTLQVSNYRGLWWVRVADGLPQTTGSSHDDTLYKNAFEAILGIHVNWKIVVAQIHFADSTHFHRLHDIWDLFSNWCKLSTALNQSNLRWLVKSLAESALKTTFWKQTLNIAKPFLFLFFYFRIPWLINIIENKLKYKHK